MIERQFINQGIKKLRIQEFIAKVLGSNGYSHAEIKRTPLGEKVLIYTSKPGLVVGKRGDNIKSLTSALKEKFKMENPEIEVVEITNPMFDANLVARMIVSSFERFGPKRFKSIGYSMLSEIIAAGAVGAEIVITGRGVPSIRSKRWRFSAGYLKKSGYISEYLVKKGYADAHLKSGMIGVKVSILTPDIIFPDKITIKTDKKEEIKTNIKEQEPKIDIEIKEEIKEEPKIIKEKRKTSKKQKENGNIKKKRNKTDERTSS